MLWKKLVKCQFKISLVLVSFSRILRRNSFGTAELVFESHLGEVYSSSAGIRVSARGRA